MTVQPSPHPLTIRVALTRHNCQAGPSPGAPAYTGSGMGDMVPFDHSLRPDEPQFVCLGCDGEFSRRSAPNPVYVLDFVFHDIECWVRWKNRGMSGMT